MWSPSDAMHMRNAWSGGVSRQRQTARVCQSVLFNVKERVRKAGDLFTSPRFLTFRRALVPSMRTCIEVYFFCCFYLV